MSYTHINNDVDYYHKICTSIIYYHDTTNNSGNNCINNFYDDGSILYAYAYVVNDITHLIKKKKNK